MASEELPTTEWFPWQHKVLDFASADEEDARTIHWVYSIEGDVGKSWLKDYMVKTYEALVVAVDKPTDVKHLILTAMKGKNNNKFKKNPIVIADLSRTESRFLDRDGNGSLSSEELLPLLQEIAPPPHKKAVAGDAKFVMDRCDSDMSGSISFDELRPATTTWMELAKELPPQPEEKAAASGFCVIL